ncbi:MAG: Gfo/Idh/MocA family oxidoreductase [Planctomycetaceae bacterium]|nr:Gfo/Idh/MocA family oxidoreductase [Planctomycetaceae bacterium]
MRHVSRRDFLARSATAAAATFAAPAILRSASPSERLRLAFIGCGGRGGANLKSMTNQKLVDVDVVALCDVNKQNLDAAYMQHPQARTYTDFRAVYDQADDIDAVIVSTTEHTHAYATMPALKLKKPVYCEKPLTRDVEECRLITLEAARAGVPTQMGTQIHGMPNYRRVVELIWSGAIGPVRECHVWVSRAWGLQSKEASERNQDRVYVTERPTEEMTPPNWLNWDLWIGPAPYRPYHEVYFPGPKWYRWWDFGNGTMSDLGSHWNDLPFWALRLDAPRTIESFGIDPHPEIAPASMTAVYEYGPRDGFGAVAGSASVGNAPDPQPMPACTVSWYQGEHKPQIWKDGGIPQWGNGVLFVGDDGMLLSDYGKHVLLPEEKFADYRRPEPFIPDSPGQHEEWLQAVKTGGKTSSPFSYAGPLTEANHLGNVAYRAGQKLEWDAANMRASNCPAADQFLKRAPRAGWSLS